MWTEGITSSTFNGRHGVGSLPTTGVDRIPLLVASRTAFMWRKLRGGGAAAPSPLPRLAGGLLRRMAWTPTSTLAHLRRRVA
jgi:hypothetical protein